MKKLENKVAVITGGNSGIGLATALLFAEQGAQVFITGRNQKTLETAISKIGHGAIGIVSDTADLAQIDNLYKQVSIASGNSSRYYLLLC